MWRKCSLNIVQEALGSDKGSNFYQSLEERKALSHSKSVRWYSQTLQEGEGEGLLTESVARVKRIEKWSEEETEGRILQEGASMLDGKKKTRLIVEGVSVWEKWVGALMICLRSKVSDMTSSFVLEDEVEKELMLKSPKKIWLKRMEGLRGVSLSNKYPDHQMRKEAGSKCQLKKSND